MTDELPTMTLKAVGVVRNKVKQAPAERDWWQETVSEIVIEPGFTGALDGLEDFSHVIVLWWMHQVTSGEVPVKVHPMGREGLPLVGLFASRSPNRPNRIGKATVRLMERSGNILRVKGLDALDSSPVIDIKPYIPGYDSVDDARVPPWITSQ